MALPGFFEATCLVSLIASVPGAPGFDGAGLS
jgi:hypothetical protein